MDNTITAILLFIRKLTIHVINPIAETQFSYLDISVIAPMLLLWPYLLSFVHSLKFIIGRPSLRY